MSIQLATGMGQCMAKNYTSHNADAGIKSNYSVEKYFKKTKNFENFNKLLEEENSKIFEQLNSIQNGEKTNERKIN